MTHNNSLKVKLSNSQFNKLKPTIKSATEVTLKLSADMMVILVMNEETNFPHKLLLTDGQISALCKAFASNSPANINLSKTQLSKMCNQEDFMADFLDHY